VGGRQDGFTLLEVLVALLVLGLLVLGLSQGVRTSLDLRQAQMRRLGNMAELDAAQRLLRTVLSRLPLSPDGNRMVGSKTAPGFSGEAERIKFVGDLPTGLGPNRRADMSLSVQNGRLVLAWTPHLHEQSLAPPAPPAETALLHGIEKVDLAYWATPAGGQTPGWQSRWAESEPPALIRLRLAFGETDRRRWPDLIVAPRP
jgi:general secretion pathway protein J